MKRTFFLLLLSIAFGMTCPLGAQTAQQVLDKTATLLKSSGGLQADFEATTFKKLSPVGTAKGTISVEGSKFMISSNQALMWFDGRTQWSLLKSSDEVNVTSPTPEEIQQINPYTFINLYKNGYNLSLKKTTYQGKSCYEVHLIARNRDNDINEMRITIDKASYLPLSVRIRQDENWTRIRVANLKTGKHWADSFFRFNHKDYPDVQIIDLR